MPLDADARCQAQVLGLDGVEADLGNEFVQAGHRCARDISNRVPMGVQRRHRLSVCLVLGL
eukprot:CAMPEP_0115766680 /NCGR_PEP_ID=MMETSP0272-20121206/103278_1 /TAXON_ID=71861 /ORGANISM="Scrippsiella trochoidea, Strain CCMP3099" /LENGTH=60 /DNA_ID=CAMNT_0003212661 /DNA_START=212 /DNA_END=394 /DNA_ORIENTATION=-